MTPEHRTELASAKAILQNPGIAVKASNLLGKPIESGLKRLPKEWGEKASDVTKVALDAAMRAALFTMGDVAEAYPKWHKLAAAVSGAAGGAFGLPALLIELPVSTTIICRSIADIARANGESLEDVSTRLACMEVFAMGGTSTSDDAAETGYFAVRSAMAKSVSDAAKYLATHKVAGTSAPALVRLIGQVASRFQIVVTQKAAAQAVPVIGAASGALINLMFIDHFQDMSRGHFTIRRLERQYGVATIKSAYDIL